MVIVRLKGGLGNQMFQFAAGYAISSKRKQSLVLDTHSGFVNDQVFKRSFSLNRLSIVGYKNASFLTRFFFQGLSKFPALTFFFRKANLGVIANENEDKALRSFKGKHIWLDGYWQSYLFFKGYEKQIFSLFSSALVYQDALVNKASIDIENDTALCMRFFEEVPGYGGNTMATDFAFYEQAVSTVKKESNGRLVVFSSNSIKAAECLAALNIPPASYILMTSDLGFSDEIATLSLVSSFKRIIISNSSFYCGLRGWRSSIIAW